MYATCSHGHRHWGPEGAAGALVVAPGAGGPRVLLTLRSAAVHQGGTWSLPGGAIDHDDADVHAAACREVVEELAVDVSGLPVLGWHAYECGGWSYSTVLLVAAAAFEVSTEGWETEDIGWFALPAVDRLAADRLLHPGFAASWPALRGLVLGAAAA